MNVNSPTANFSSQAINFLLVNAFWISLRLYCTVEEPDLAINMYKKHRQVNVFVDLFDLNYIVKVCVYFSVYIISAVLPQELWGGGGDPSVCFPSPPQTANRCFFSVTTVSAAEK